jgi:hypothetical protein
MRTPIPNMGTIVTPISHPEIHWMFNAGLLKRLDPQGATFYNS